MIIEVQFYQFTLLDPKNLVQMLINNYICVKKLPFSKSNKKSSHILQNIQTKLKSPLFDQPFFYIFIKF